MNTSEKQFAEHGKGTKKLQSVDTKTRLCLCEEHSKWDIRYYLCDCRECPKDVKDRLLREHRGKRKDNAKRAMNALDDGSRSVVLNATFGEQHRTIICADICSDNNILDTYKLDTFKAAGVEHTVKDLLLLRTFKMTTSLSDGNAASLVCKKVVTVDTELHIRHRFAVILRGVCWLVTEQAVDELLLRRPVLEALGLNTRDILASAAEKHAGTVDMTDLLNQESDDRTRGKVARILEGVYHVESGADDANLYEDTGWLDLGPENPLEKENALEQKIYEAKNSGMTAMGLKHLKSLLVDFSDVIKLRLDAREPADIDTLRVTLKHNAVPTRSEQRRYPPSKKNFLSRNVRQLVKLGRVKKATAPEWVSAPLIVPKRPPAMYRLTVDYRPVNNATVQTFLSMPNIEAEISDARGCKAFAAIDFCSGYWQAPLHPDSQPLFAFMTPHGVVMPTRTTKGGTNSAANFQEKVAGCFNEFREHFKAWIDDFILSANDEKALLRVLRRFLQTRRSRRLIVSLPKSDFFLQKAKWCGRIIDAHVDRFNLKNLAGLKSPDFPQTARELCEYIHGGSWVSVSIPRFVERVVVLRELFEAAYAKAVGNRKKRALANFPSVT